MSTAEGRISAREVITAAYVEWVNTDARTTRGCGTVSFGDFVDEVLSDEGYVILDVED